MASRPAQIRNFRLPGEKAARWLSMESGRTAYLSAPGEAAPAVKHCLDLEGAFLYPGFCDTHLHVHMIGEAKLRLPLANCRSKTELLYALAGWARSHPELDAIRGFGWNDNNWNDPTLPTATELDAAAGSRPVLLTKADGHAGLANSALCRLMDRDNSRTLFLEKNYEKAMAAMPRPSTAYFRQALALAQTDLLLAGITGVHESAATEEIVESFRGAEAAGELLLRTRLALYGKGAAAMAKSGKTPSSELLRAYGLKFFLDGSLGSRTAWLETAYIDPPGKTGSPTLSETELEAGLKEAEKLGLQPLVHAIGSRAVNTALIAFAKHPKITRPRLEHAELVTVRGLELAEKVRGLVVACQPQHIASDLPLMQKILPEKEIQASGRWRSLQKAGAVLCGGSDAPMDALSPLAGIAHALAHPHNAEENLSREEALALYTTGAAYASGEENYLGKIAPGFAADFTALDRDLLTCPQSEIRASETVATIVAGKVAFARALQD